MNNNPFAKIFYNAMQEDVLHKSIFLNHSNNEQTPERVKKFLSELNCFFITSNIPPIDSQRYAIDEKSLRQYALFLRGYMRDAQKVLHNIDSKFTCDQDMLRLFDASSHYVVSCNGQIKGDNHNFDDNAGYLFCKLNLSDGIENLRSDNQHTLLNPKRKNLVLFMPFRIKNNEAELKKWLYKNMYHSLDNKQVFGQDVDVYVAYFPIQKSRCAKISSTIRTILHPETYVEEQDLSLVKQAFLPFISSQIEVDNEGKVLQAKKYNKEQLKQNFSNLTFMSYCAGTADAHRISTALEQISSQVYSEAETKEALHNLFLISYGFLPLSKNLNYSGVHFFSNEANDTGKKEPFSKMNSPELYETCKYQAGSTLPAKVSIMPDQRNFVVALRNEEKFTLVNNKEKLIDITDPEYGHNIGHITGSHFGYNFGSQQFKTVLENAASGKRGKDVFNRRQDNDAAITTSLTMAAMLNRKQNVI